MIDRERLLKVLAMFSSNHDGVVAAAARAAERMLKEAGLEWKDVVQPRQQAPHVQPGAQYNHTYEPRHPSEHEMNEAFRRAREFSEALKRKQAERDRYATEGIKPGAGWTHKGPFGSWMDDDNPVEAEDVPPPPEPPRGPDGLDLDHATRQQLDAEQLTRMTIFFEKHPAECRWIVLHRHGGHLEAVMWKSILQTGTLNPLLLRIVRHRLNQERA